MKIFEQQLETYFNDMDKYNNIRKEFFNNLQSYLQQTYPKYLKYNIWQEEFKQGGFTFCSPNSSIPT